MTLSATKNTLIDLTGQRFGIWLVIAQSPRRDNKTRWLCECQTCGARMTKRSVILRKSQYAVCYGKHRERVAAGTSRLIKPSGHAAATERYTGYRSVALKRGLPFSLSREQFIALSQQDCHYCGAAPSQRAHRRHFNGAFIYNGIDRKDSGAGYAFDNCVPCCGTCNVMKQDLPYDTFLGHVAQIHAMHSDAIPRTSMVPIAMGTMGNTRPAYLEGPIATPTWEDRCKAVAGLRAAGKTVTDIATILNLSRGTVGRTLARLKTATHKGTTV